MTTSLRSWRCLRRRHFARISIIDMLGESSMNSGALETSPIRRASRVQSSSVSLPVRMWCSGTRASAESRRIVISLRLISSENTTVAMLLLIAADARDVEPKRRVVGRHHRAPGEVQVIGVVHLDAPHGNAGRRPHSDDVARPDLGVSPRSPLLVHQPLALQAEHVVVGGEGQHVTDGGRLGPTPDALGRETALVAKADDQLARVGSQPRRVTANCTARLPVDGAISVEQSCEQVPAADPPTPADRCRDVLVPEDLRRTQQAGTVPFGRGSAGIDAGRSRGPAVRARRQRDRR